MVNKVVYIVSTVDNLTQVTSLSWCGKEVARSGLVELNHVTASGSWSLTSSQREITSDGTPTTCFQVAMGKLCCRRRTIAKQLNQVHIQRKLT